MSRFAQNLKGASILANHIHIHDQIYLNVLILKYTKFNLSISKYSNVWRGQLGGEGHSLKRALRFELMLEGERNHIWSV